MKAAVLFFIFMISANTFAGKCDVDIRDADISSDLYNALRDYGYNPIPGNAKRQIQTDVFEIPYARGYVANIFFTQPISGDYVLVQQYQGKKEPVILTSLGWIGGFDNEKWKVDAQLRAERKFIKALMPCQE